MPFIAREMKRLKLVKNIELKKNKSTSNISSNNMEGINFLKKRHFCKIYRYYFSKSRIEERLMNQKIIKMRKELKEKHEKEQKEYNDIFHKNYPPENETEYNNEIKVILKNENITMEKEKEKYEKIRQNFLTKKHDEYISKMGIEFEKGFNILNKRFKKENDEQNSAIKKIILNHQLKEIERNNIMKENKKKEKDNKKPFYFSQYMLNFRKEREHKKNKDKIVKNNLRSKIFTFYAGGNPYKTIIL